MLLNQLSPALYEIRSTQKTNLYMYIYIYKIKLIEYYGSNLPDIRFVCKCFDLAMPVFSVFPSFYVYGDLTLSLKTIIVRFSYRSARTISTGRVSGCILPKLGNSHVRTLALLISRGC